LKLIDKKGGLSMQEAIENYINIQSELGKALDKIEDVIDKVAKAEIRKARKKQYREWRKLNK